MIQRSIFHFYLNILLIACVTVVGLTYFYSNYCSNNLNSRERYRLHSAIQPVAEIRPGNKWIVVTSISLPTEDVKRLASFTDWNLVVVADTKTPLDWELENAHFLSVEFQKKSPFSLVSSLSYKSYTRKNIGYLYAISQGAEWIYDTDDDNKPYGLGLNQFNFKETTSGVRFRPANGTATEIQQRLFNPYRFYGMDQMWPRGFPLEHFVKHTNGNETQVLCYKMKRAAVQQGLVHHDPDVDAIYRLQHADSRSGLNVKFNKFAPPITLSVGTYSPWNSQNTMFHKSAFHTLFLPTTVSFRTTDIWRSFISQKILHLSGLTVSFVPTNAVHFRNAHNYLKDFKDEQQVYEDSGRIIEFLHNWNCKTGSSIQSCIVQLANDLVEVKLLGEEDESLMEMFLNDLTALGFEFPSLIGDNYVDPYAPSANESSREVNCRRMYLEFKLVDPNTNVSEISRTSQEKLNYFGDIIKWCNETRKSSVSINFPSPKQLASLHEKSYVLKKHMDSVLIVVNNYPWKYGMGLIQRLYQPYFATVIFCGSWYPAEFSDDTNFTPTLFPINYIHMNPAEIEKGYFAYHCVTLAKELGLHDVEGYFLVADDTVFNIWQRIDFSRVHHLTGVTCEDSPIWWSIADVGMDAAKRVVGYINNSTAPEIAETWTKFETGLKKNGYVKNNLTVMDEMTSGLGRSVSDFFYIPTSESEYYASLMRIFYKNKLFLEIAVNKFLKSVNHQTSLSGNSSYLWGNDRNIWDTFYSRDMVAMHPLKLGYLKTPNEHRIRYCKTIIQSWSDIIFGGSQDFKVKADNDTDYKNG
ncbi:uncharacterized protein CELE_F02C9.2 [Caenorhabditis elegans]|uniref:Uncharacterized protein n=1 Tax=Caenorhabditis elegans TaxID=6239 RepID=P91204_CAEEL|nr:Uncharacterized protein CELE_F02C9.2 [Caenorhabditis elegans]CCD66877.2 Uncharacterized protein CELE_F02C9.2 [Caenorhabditis elegans]|eukprot:NP_503859.3 Uncharacterized protein CELE_F02C9.2 [Caenorhabditis elegans]